MTAMVLHYAVNPVIDIWTTLDRFFQIVGYSRAAGELYRLGYHEAAENCMKQVRELKSK